MGILDFFTQSPKDEKEGGVSTSGDVVDAGLEAKREALKEKRRQARLRRGSENMSRYNPNSSATGKKYGVEPGQLLESSVGPVMVLGITFDKLGLVVMRIDPKSGVPPTPDEERMVWHGPDFATLAVDYGLKKPEKMITVDELQARAEERNAQGQEDLVASLSPEDDSTELVGEMVGPMKRDVETSPPLEEAPREVWNPEEYFRLLGSWYSEQFQKPIRIIPFVHFMRVLSSGSPSVREHVIMIMSRLTHDMLPAALRGEVVDGEITFPVSGVSQGRGVFARFFETNHGGKPLSTANEVTNLARRCRNLWPLKGSDGRLYLKMNEIV